MPVEATTGGSQQEGHCLYGSDVEMVVYLVNMDVVVDVYLNACV